jgi:hypothetical protein
LLYSFSLLQVSTLVPPNNLQACSDCEAQQWNEGIPKSNAIDVGFQLSLGGHPKPAIDGHLKTGHHTT